MSERSYTVEWKKLERKLTGMQRYTPRNAMRAAATSAFRVIDFENARQVKAGPYKTPDHSPAFRRRASKKGGYRYKVRQSKDGSTRASSAYGKRSKYPELTHAWWVERGYNSAGGRVDGRWFRQRAFDTKKRAAQAKIVQAMRVAIDLAAMHPRGNVRVGDVERTVGGWGK